MTNTAAKLETNLLGRSLSLVSLRFVGLRLERLRLGRLVAGLSLALAVSLPLDLGCGSGTISGLCVGHSAMASVGSDVRLSQLEVKFFKHTYPKDEEAVRLERLEKMIFGEARTGASETRLKNLADTVPNLGAVASEDSDKSEGSTTTTSSSSSSGRSGSSTVKPVNNNDSDLDLSEERSQGKKPGGQVLSGESKYPAVTALEQSIFKRDYASDPVADRLNRLETKVFGKPSKFTDLSERVDALKEKTRVDVAKQAPPGTDWLDDEDDDISFPAPKQASRQPVARSDGEDGRSFSGRDLRKDMQNAFGSRASGAASGGYGMGSTGSASRGSNSASGAYGMGSIGSPRSAGRALDEEDDDLPPVAPRRAASAGSTARAQTGASSGRAAASDRFDSDSGGTAVPGGAIGLSSKVTALENAVLGKTFASDPLIERVSRLEETVFPNKPDSGASLSLPERVAKLVEKVPVAAAPPKTARANRSRRDDFDDDLDMGSGMSSLGSMGGMGSGMTSQSQTQTRGSGGLGKIINSIGNMLGGGYGSYGTYGGYTNGYGVPGAGAMVRDPSTGFLVDSMSGNLINPATGQVVGRSTGYPAGAYGNSAYGGYGTGLGGLPAGAGFGYPAGMGMGLGVPVGVPMGGYSSFNNGFSPYGYPAGGYGLGGSGIRFGGSGFGVRF